MQVQTEWLSSRHTDETCYPLLQQVIERVEQVLHGAGLDLTEHRPDDADHATLEHAR